MSRHDGLAALARFTHPFSRFDRTLSSSLLLMIILDIPFSATTDLDSTAVDATHLQIFSLFIGVYAV